VKTVVVSACLAGIPCRYNGSAKPDERVKQLFRDKKVIAACPEALAGLKIPRPPAEISGGDGFDVLNGSARVYNKIGTDITEEFLRGAERFLAFVQEKEAQEVWLKAKSPSCGVSCVYDGTFQGKLHEGCGVTCALLKNNGIKVVEIP
jgi:uncharacterized protein YbbK (DUF523 family)